jgi:hypothetical protein
MADFVRWGATSLYLPDGIRLGDARLGYLLPGATAERIGLVAALDAEPGWFIFVPAFPTVSAVLDDFLKAATAFLQAPGREYVRFAWFQLPDARPLRALTVALTGSAGAWTTRDRVDVVFANYALRLARSNAVAVDDAVTGLTFTAPAGQQNALIASPLGLGPQTTFAIDGPVALPLVVEHGGGCFGFVTHADQAGLTSLDAGIRYFVTSYDTPGYVDTQRYPVFDLAGGAAAARDATSVSLTGCFDPVDQTNAARTFLGVAADAPLRTYYRNALGEVIRAAPRPDAALVFRTVLAAVPDGDAPPDDGAPYYLAPMGSFEIAVDATATGAGAYRATLMAGLSGAEYAGLAASGTTVLRFEPDGAAYAPATFTLSSGDEVRVSFSGLSAAATTSYANLFAEATTAAGAAETLTYFAQPDAAVLHQPAGDVEPSFLSYLALPAGSLPPLGISARTVGATEPPPFPLAPYAGTALPAVSFFRDLELKLLSPARRAAIAASGAPPPRVAAAGDGDGRSTTPQGLLLERAGGDWATLTLAQSVLPSGATEDLVLHDVHGPLREALQSNQLFLVASDAQLFLSSTSVPYAMSPFVRDELVAVAQVPKTIVDRLAALDGTSYDLLDAYREALLRQLSPYTLTTAAMTQLALVPGFPLSVIQALAPLTGTTYPTYDAIAAAIATKLAPDEVAQWGQVVIGYAAAGYAMDGDQPVTYGASMLNYGSVFRLVVGDYTFDLSPYMWSTYRTVLIFKFAAGRLRDLIDDVTAWANPTAFNASVPAVQQQLQQIAASADPADPDMRFFVETVLDDPAWNGILALSARVPLDGLPQQLEGLAAGIDPSQFTAHHVGISVTPIVPDVEKKLVAKPSTMFGLIDYESSGIVDTTPAYQFEVLQLKVLLANSAVADFASRVQLLANELFDEGASLRGAATNVIEFLGAYVRSGEDGSYLFTNDAVNVFDMPTSAVLDRVVVSRAQFVTLTPRAGADVEQVQTKFLLAGTIVFRSIPGFDVFSFGADVAGSNAGLSYTSLAIDMEFDDLTPSYKTFAFDTTAVAFDVATSTARAGSLYAHFPLQLTGLAAGDAETRPDKANYMPVNTPMAGSGGLRDRWYALTFSLNLGTPGALAAEIGFTAGFIAAWSPAGGALAAFVGLSIPGVKNGRRAISLQGVLTLSFGDLNFVVNGTSYILEMRTIALSVLALTFPPTGQTSILLFGDPSGADRETLGWYAAFNKPTGNQQSTKPPLGGLAPGVLQWAEHARREVVALADLRPPTT